MDRYSEWHENIFSYLLKESQKFILWYVDVTGIILSFIIHIKLSQIAYLNFGGK